MIREKLVNKTLASAANELPNVKSNKNYHNITIGFGAAISGQREKEIHFDTSPLKKIPVVCSTAWTIGHNPHKHCS